MEVPQNQKSPESVNITVRNRGRVRFQRGYGGDEGFFFLAFFVAFFRARPGRLELSDSFRALPW